MQQHVIVGIGASAGGLQALSDFFDNVPSISNYSYVVVQHLSPDHKSLMGELLAKNTNIPIKVVEEGEELHGNQVYLIPPSKLLTIKEGKFVLEDKPKDKQLSLPIDIFFNSLATNCEDNCVAIVLSGTGSDGSKGIKSIKANGGLVLVQDPEQAKFNGMPQSAIDTTNVDKVLKVEHMYDEIRNYVDVKDQNVFGSDFQIDEEKLERLLGKLKTITAMDFSQYKRATLFRRIARRLNVLKIKTIEGYIEHLDKHPEEGESLYEELLIGVTRFFRDKKLWEILQRKVIPSIVRRKKDGGHIKMWDVGCCSGEEPYSLAMMILEEIDKQNKNVSLKIFATDIAKKSLEKGSKGKYPRTIIEDFPEEKYKKYFKEVKKGLQVTDELRQCIIFSPHNIINDPPFRNMDLVMCRNLLIYLQPDLQDKVMQILHHGLGDQGYLVLGASENIGVNNDNFELIDRKWKIFKNTHPVNRLRSDFFETMGNSTTTRSRIVGSNKNTEHKTFKDGLREQIGQAVIEQFGATSVVIDDEYNVVEAMGSFSKYASLPTSGFTTNLLEMLPKSMEPVLINAVRRASRSGSTVFTKNVSLAKDEDDASVVDILVKPLKRNKSGASNYILTIMDGEPLEKANVIVEHEDYDKTAQNRIKDLEEELKATQFELSQALEEAETSNEELQASNEELLASNEELQSTNEELQSVNEELHTVNTEHIQKMEDLALLNADMENLLDSSKIGTVFLDKDLIIRKFTPAIKEHFNLMRQDIGRSIENFISNFGIRRRRTLMDNAKKVMATGNPFEKRIVSKSGKHYIQRITPFIAANGKIDGTVITFVDITKVHKSQEQLRVSEEKFRSFYEDDPVMHISVDLDNAKVVDCNRLFAETLGYDDKKEVLDRSIFDFYDEESKIKSAEFIDVLKAKNSIKNEEMFIVSKSGEKICVILNSEGVEDADGNVVRSRSTMMDITELKQAQEILKQQKEDLERINTDLEQFVSICSHDLQEPLSTIRFSSDFIAKKYSENLNEKAMEYLGYIHNAAGRMADQIKALLEHSRIGRDLDKTKVDIQELVEVVKYDLSKSAKDRNATITVGSMPTIDAYQTELRLLFQNLISNAIKYSREGVPPVVRISAFQDDGYWTFAITDNGKGIMEEDLSQIFHIFSRSSDSDKYEGTGVGLAHCEKIVKLHEGKIWVDSQYGVGSTFYFKLKE